MFSLEVFPPKRTSPVGTIYDTLDGLQGLDPDFISVTYGTGKSSDRTLTARIAYASEQICELVARGVDGVHLYTMNHPCVSRRIWSNVKPFFV